MRRLELAASLLRFFWNHELGESACRSSKSNGEQFGRLALSMTSVLLGPKRSFCVLVHTALSESA